LNRSDWHHLRLAHGAPPSPLWRKPLEMSWQGKGVLIKVNNE
jgi:hypothetical protein